ncbi:MAG: hypothetical protein DRP59_04055 [Spirochaetes bacterium]|nr:MAG: hypothetical protein DRP59_04055 [Spirochaetota bacterium]
MNKKIINFNIENIDGLGQGVYRGKPVTFIDKTLPGEEGTAAVYREAKGVRFAAVESLTKESPLRITPECPHFDRCTGCHYLHMEYPEEINLKKSYLERLFGVFYEGVISVFTASKRFRYRNRIQLHYDLEAGSLGFISKLSISLINAEKCLLPEEAVTAKVKELYDAESWKSCIPEGSPVKGTIEVYQKYEDKSPAVSVNKPYASGGFLQVNREMNSVLIDLVNKAYNNYVFRGNNPLVLDIYGGNGNLTRSFKNARVLIADKVKMRMTQTGENPSTAFYTHDLIRKSSINNLHSYTKRRYNSPADLLVFDPPRKGVKLFGDWAETFAPENIFYVSCNPETLKRDAQKIKDTYELKEISMIDLFPGTRHFETFAVFKKRQGEGN